METPGKEYFLREEGLAKGLWGASPRGGRISSCSFEPTLEVTFSPLRLHENTGSIDLHTEAGYLLYLNSATQQSHLKWVVLSSHFDDRRHHDPGRGLFDTGGNQNSTSSLRTTSTTAYSLKHSRKASEDVLFCIRDCRIIP